GNFPHRVTKPCPSGTTLSHPICEFLASTRVSARAFSFLVVEEQTERICVAELVFNPKRRWQHLCSRRGCDFGEGSEQESVDRSAPGERSGVGLLAIRLPMVEDVSSIKLQSLGPKRTLVKTILALVLGTGFEPRAWLAEPVGLERVSGNGHRRGRKNQDTQGNRRAPWHCEDICPLDDVIQRDSQRAQGHCQMIPIQRTTNGAQAAKHLPLVSTRCSRQHW